jgi:hypothetical protein
MNQEVIIEQLKVMGFDPVCIYDGKYMFTYKDLKFLLSGEEENEEFLSVSIPIFDEFAEEDKLTVHETVNKINILVRYVKLTIQDEQVSAVLEHRLCAGENLEELLENIIAALTTATSLYMKKKKGEKVPYLDYNPEEDEADTDDMVCDSDTELESALEKLLENEDE